MKIITEKNAALFLAFNAVLWGTSYVLSKMLLSFLPRFSILFLCSLGGLVLTVILFHRSLKSISLRTMAVSAGISGFSVLSNTFFMLALQFTSSSNTAFIVQLSVVFTPFLMAIIEKKLPEGKTVFSVATALLGLFLLTCNIGTFSFNPGDMLALGNAFFFSVFLTSQKIFLQKANPVHFMLVHHCTNTAVFLTLAAVFEFRSIDYSGLISPAFALLMGLSIFIAGATVLIQSVAIRHVRPEKATLVYTLEPVATLVLAYIFIGERLEGFGPVAGCLLILLSIVHPLFFRKRRQKQLRALVPVSPLREHTR